MLKKLMAVYFMCRGNQPPKQPNYQIVFGMDLASAWQEHLKPREDQKRAKDVNYPVKLQQSGAQSDKYRAEDQCAQDAIEQHPVFVLWRDREIAEYKDKDKDVVYRERVFQHVSGK